MINASIYTFSGGKGLLQFLVGIYECSYYYIYTVTSWRKGFEGGRDRFASWRKKNVSVYRRMAEGEVDGVGSWGR